MGELFDIEPREGFERVRAHSAGLFARGNFRLRRVEQLFGKFLPSAPARPRGGGREKIRREVRNRGRGARENFGRVFRLGESAVRKRQPFAQRPERKVGPLRARRKRRMGGVLDEYRPGVAELPFAPYPHVAQAEKVYRHYRVTSAGAQGFKARRIFRRQVFEKFRFANFPYRPRRLRTKVARQENPPRKARFFHAREYPEKRLPPRREKFPIFARGARGRREIPRRKREIREGVDFLRVEFHAAHFKRAGRARPQKSARLFDFCALRFRNCGAEIFPAAKILCGFGG